MQQNSIMTFRRSSVCLSALLALHTVATFAAAPTVSRVEPPNWWPGHSLNPVRLLLSGTNLAHARVEAPAGFAAVKPQISDDGTHLFVDLLISTNAAPGPVSLRRARLPAPA